MESFDYDREEVIRLEVNVIYFLPLFWMIPSSFMLFSGPQLWLGPSMGCASTLCLPSYSLSSSNLRDGVCIGALLLPKVTGTARCCSSFYALHVSPVLVHISLGTLTRVSVRLSMLW